MIEEKGVFTGPVDVMDEGFGFLREKESLMASENDLYLSKTIIASYDLRPCDQITAVKNDGEGNAVEKVLKINGHAVGLKRPKFKMLTPIFPEEKFRLSGSLSARMMNLVSPIGKGQRGLIVAPPKAGKTTLIKQVAKSIIAENPDVTVICLLIDERPEEVTDIRDSVKGMEVVASTFDESPQLHCKKAEVTIERAKRMAEYGKDVVILLDSMTRLTRAYNITTAPSGRTLSGGLDPAAMYMPKRFFGAARKFREGGSITILATALVHTGSLMDDIIYEEFKGTGNMEITLSRDLQEKRIFPAIDLRKSGTRREDLLLTKEELSAMENVRRTLTDPKRDSELIDIFKHTKTDEQLLSALTHLR